MYEDTSNVYMVTELLRGGELLDKILENKQLSERYAADVMAVVGETVAYLHRQGVCTGRRLCFVFRWKMDAVLYALFKPRSVSSN